MQGEDKYSNACIQPYTYKHTYTLKLFIEFLPSNFTQSICQQRVQQMTFAKGTTHRNSTQKSLGNKLYIDAGMPVQTYEVNKYDRTTTHINNKNLLTK